MEPMQVAILESKAESKTSDGGLATVGTGVAALAVLGAGAAFVLVRC